MVFEDPSFSIQTLQEYIDLIIYKDLIDRYRLQNHYLLKLLVKYCFTNISTLLSFNKLYNEFKSQGIQLSKNTLYNYQQYLEDAFALFLIPEYSRSIAEQSKNPKKIYTIDIGFKTAMGISKDIGRKYENITFLHLRHKTKEINYWKNNQEVDFIFWFNNQQNLINVAYDLSSPKTLQREINGLVEGTKALNIQHATLLNAEIEDKITSEGKTIYVVPLWKWLIQGITQ